MPHARDAAGTGAWAEEGGRFTALFEGSAIDWMKHAAIATVAARLQLT